MKIKIFPIVLFYTLSYSMPQSCSYEKKIENIKTTILVKQILQKKLIVIIKLFLLFSSIVIGFLVVLSVINATRTKMVDLKAKYPNIEQLEPWLFYLKGKEDVTIPFEKYSNYNLQLPLIRYGGKHNLSIDPKFQKLFFCLESDCDLYNWDLYNKYKGCDYFFITDTSLRNGFLVVAAHPLLKDDVECYLRCLQRDVTRDPSRYSLFSFLPNKFEFDALLSTPIFESMLLSFSRGKMEEAYPEIKTWKVPIWQKDENNTVSYVKEDMLFKRGLNRLKACFPESYDYILVGNEPDPHDCPDYGSIPYTIEKGWGKSSDFLIPLKN